MSLIKNHISTLKEVAVNILPSFLVNNFTKLIFWFLGGDFHNRYVHTKFDSNRAAAANFQMGKHNGVNTQVSSSPKRKIKLKTRLKHRNVCMSLLHCVRRNNSTRYGLEVSS